MIIADTNLIVYLYIESEYSKFADALFQKDSNWYVPLLWRSKFRNVLTQLTRAGRMDLEHAFHLYYEAQRIVAGKEYQPDPLEVMRLASESGCSAYDCEFIHLAQYFETCLITMDKKLLYAFPEHTRKLTEYSHPPAGTQGIT